MRLTHYEDGSLCGERFCINLIRHLFHLQASLWSFALQSSGTFSAVNIIQLYFENVLTPSPVSGKVKVKPPPVVILPLAVIFVLRTSDMFDFLRKSNVKEQKGRPRTSFLILYRCSEIVCIDAVKL